MDGPMKNVRWAAFSFEAIRVDEIRKHFINFHALVSSLLHLNVIRCSILQLHVCSFNPSKHTYICLLYTKIVQTYFSFCTAVIDHLAVSTSC